VITHVKSKQDNGPIYFVAEAGIVGYGEDDELIPLYYVMFKDEKGKVSPIGEPKEKRYAEYEESWFSRYQAEAEIGDILDLIKADDRKRREDEEFEIEIGEAIGYVEQFIVDQIGRKAG
jgi:hypothetical protein